MKRIEFIAPVESMRGNLSGSQDLKYRENNNPAYEAPNGDAHALNYQPRFVGAKRSKDGLKYFSVRTKSTTKLNAKTRLTMAVLGSIAAMKSALKTLHVVDWAQLQRAYAYMVEHGIDVPNTFDKWINREFGTMLRYKTESVAYTIAAASINVTVVNPFTDAQGALVINQKTWYKFFEVLNTNASPTMVFYVDGHKFYTINPSTWEELFDDTSTQNPNMRASYAGISIPSAGANPKYNDQPIYNANGVVQTGESAIVADAGYTTIAPQA